MFANFSKTRKNWRFPPSRPWGPFSLISHLCPDFIQMSEFLYLSCPDVKLWWFSSFSQTFRKIEKIEDFTHPGPGDPFRLFHTCAQISSKWLNFYILVVLMSNYDDFLHFRKLFENSKKLGDFPHPGPGDPFHSFHTCAQISSKWVNFYILVVLMSNYDDFLHFRKLFEKAKKIGRFPPPRPWGPFSLVSHLCLDFIQMSEFLYLSCPDVKLWWFSSFSQTFWKMEKIEDFPHAGPGDPFRLFHTCAQISSKWVNFYILVVLMSNYDDFLHFRKLFEKVKKLKISPTPGPGDPFRSFHACAQIWSKWVNFYILVVLMSNYDDFLHFRKLFIKSKNLEDFPHPVPGEPFRSFHTCAQISSKWVNFYILVVLMSNYDDFLHFRKLFEKSKKLKISPTQALGTLFAHFTLVPRFHPNEWIFIS